MPDKSITVRFIIAVALGIAIPMILSLLTHLVLFGFEIFPPPFKPMFETRLVTIALIYHSIYAVIAAFVTAKIARDKSRKAAFFVGSKEAIMWIIGTILLWHHAPPWYNITKAILGIPLALLGGWLYKHYRKNSEEHKLIDESEPIKSIIRTFLKRKSQQNPN